MYAITREYWFAAAHRLEGHPKCGRLHGHNYRVVVELSCEFLTKEGWVMDFGEVDDFVKPVINKLDHSYLVSHENTLRDDPYAALAIERDEAIRLPREQSTAECLAEFIHAQVCDNMSLNGPELKVTVWETVKSSATYSE